MDMLRALATAVALAYFALGAAPTSADTDIAALMPLNAYRVVVLNEAQQRELHEEALFHPKHGIKVQAHPVTTQARSVLLEGVRTLESLGAAAVILGCTEIPLGLPERRLGTTYLVNPGRILARALIREFQPDRLRHWNWE